MLLTHIEAVGERAGLLLVLREGNSVLLSVRVALELGEKEDVPHCEPLRVRVGELVALRVAPRALLGDGEREAPEGEAWGDAVAAPLRDVVCVALTLTLGVNEVEALEVKEGVALAEPEALPGPGVPEAVDTVVALVERLSVPVPQTVAETLLLGVSAALREG